jgi:hypothetical protein
VIGIVVGAGRDPPADGSYRPTRSNSTRTQGYLLPDVLLSDPTIEPGPLPVPVDEKLTVSPSAGSTAAWVRGAVANGANIKAANVQNDSVVFMMPSLLFR